MLNTLPALIAALPAELQTAFHSIFVYEQSYGQAIPPAEMHPWVIRQFGSIQAVEQQHILKITNRLTLEGALFNPLRARRPSGEAASDAELERRIAAELQDDMFATPLTDTTADVFGRIHGNYCVTASNVAKYEAWHGLIIPDEAHPLRFSAAQLADYLATALEWLRKAHSHDPGAIYPMITWNCMPKSGATIVHAHWQMALTRGMHYGRIELWRRAAERYTAETERNYWRDLADIHTALGLNLDTHAPGLNAFAHLTALRNNEIVLLCNVDAVYADQGQALAHSLHYFLRQLIDRRGMRAFNVSIALPPLATTSESWQDMPIVVRLGDRGPALTSRNDWGAMELYATGVITNDPFEVVQLLRG